MPRLVVVEEFAGKAYFSNAEFFTLYLFSVLSGRAPRVAARGFGRVSF